MMAFSLSSKSNLGESLASVTDGEVAGLRSRTNGSTVRPPLDERVHETRKVIKRLRALLRIYHGALAPALFEREDARLRELGQSLGGLRDEAALRESLARLVDSAKGPDRARLTGGVPSMTRALGERAPPLHEAEASLSVAHDALGALATRAADFRLERAGWSAIEPGFRRTYARGRRALERAHRRPTEKRLHAFRREAKRHQAHLSLLEPLWPGPIKAVRHEVSELGDLLGDDHDLSMLERRFDELHERPLHAQLEASFYAATERRHAELRRRAFELGARIYGESPKRLAARFGDYFDAWT